jgi:hypothetical protein
MLPEKEKKMQSKLKNKNELWMIATQEGCGVHPFLVRVFAADACEAVNTHRLRQ